MDLPEPAAVALLVVLLFAAVLLSARS